MALFLQGPQCKQQLPCMCRPAFAFQFQIKALSAPTHLTKKVMKDGFSRLTEF